jgi:hypothetical protein
VYTLDGGTYDNNQAMVQRAAGWVQAAGCEEVYQLDNDNSAEVSAAQIQEYPLQQLVAQRHPEELFLRFSLDGCVEREKR